MTEVTTNGHDLKEVTGSRRSVRQQAKDAIRDVYDVAIELITNADDAYQRLGGNGTIEIDVERRRGKQGHLIRFRDHAMGMSLDEMDRKLSKTGGRESELEKGAVVRGTNSRGAKDIAALGRVIFESITEDGLYHRSEISQHFMFKRVASEKASKEHRRQTGISNGTGTLVTIELAPHEPVRLHKNFKSDLERLVSIRDIVSDPRREILVRDLNQGRSDRLSAIKIEAKECVKQKLVIPGYPDADVKLIIKRAKKPFDNEPKRFRLGGIQIKSRHAIHESTLFDPQLEQDSHARWFFGRVTCEYIDTLWNEFDDRFEANDDDDPDNMVPIIDPRRRAGLTKQHPFTQALAREVLKRLRPLVEEERERAESQRAQVENTATRKRLNALERAAIKFMDDMGDTEESSRDDSTKARGSRFVQSGYLVSPPYFQLVVGQSVNCRIDIRQETFAEFEVGATVEIQCVSSEVEANRRFASLEAHPAQDGVLQARWSVKGIAATKATGVRVTAGSISREIPMEVFARESDKYADVTGLQISKKSYKIPSGKKKRVRVLAPLALVDKPMALETTIRGSGLALVGEKIIRPNERMGVAICDLTVRAKSDGARSELTVALRGQTAQTELVSVLPEGAGIKITLVDESFGNQRSKWKNNVLEVSARHESLSRYLGSKVDNFPGQDTMHCRTILAEIVTDAVCAKVLAGNIEDRREEFEGADWDFYYAEYTKLISQFGPIAHKLQCPEG